MEQVVDAPGPAPASSPSPVADSITRGTLISPADCIDLEENLSALYNGSLAFRGQSRTFGTLVPSFRRLFLNKKSVRTAELIESELIKAFREHYRTMKTSMSEMPPSDAIAAGRDLRCLSVMQHYGVPTRLLDWTANFWTAMYFACAGDPGEDAELWFYDRDAFAVASRDRKMMCSINDSLVNDAPILNRRELRAGHRGDDAAHAAHAETTGPSHGRGIRLRRPRAAHPCDATERRRPA